MKWIKVEDKLPDVDKVMEELVKKMCELYPQIPKKDIELYVALMELCREIDSQSKDWYVYGMERNNRR